jgi:type I restriction enzyme S subunit
MPDNIISYTVLNEFVSESSPICYGIQRWKEFGKIRIPLPSIEEQEKIVTTIAIADEEISILNEQLESLDLQKKALMQQLLTGKRRVKVDP